MADQTKLIELSDKKSASGIILTPNISETAFELGILDSQEVWEIEFDFFGNTGNTDDENKHSVTASQRRIYVTKKQEGKGYQILVYQAVHGLASELLVVKKISAGAGLSIYMQALNATDEIAVRISNGEDMEETARFSPFFANSAVSVSGILNDQPGSIFAEVKLYNIAAMDKDFLSFRVGNIVFRCGDMFNIHPIRYCNLILLPAATNGNVNYHIANRAAELGIPPASKKPAGIISTFKLNNQTDIIAGYAYSVKEDNSSVEIIDGICNRLLELIDDDRSILGVNIPLFGTGAGKLSPVKVAVIYDVVLNQETLEIPIIVSIGSEEYFSSVKRHFSGRYVPVSLDKKEEKPRLILQLEKDLGQSINPSDFEINTGGQIIGLNLSNNTISDGTLLTPFEHLISLNLNGQSVKDFSFLGKRKDLAALYLADTGFVDLSFLKTMHALTSLDLSGNEHRNFEALSGLKKLRYLHLAGNRITDTGFLAQMKKLEYLDLSGNEISDISGLTGLKNLTTLNLGKNRIRNITVLGGMARLHSLNFSDNRVGDASVVSKLKNLRFLRADNNPFVKLYDLNLDENDSHHFTLKNYLAMQAEADLRDLQLPAKVILLGNHASGKSSLLSYLIDGEFNEAVDSTHIIQIEKLYKGDPTMPEAIFFDFGGQDFYHGIYKTFLTGGAVYLVLWNPRFNTNRRRIDIKGRDNQDFSLSYWFGQKNYLENEIFDGETDPVLLIQSHRDESKIQNHNCLFSSDMVLGEFHLTLKNNVGEVNDLGLRYLESSILELVSESKVKKKVPQWYIDFINFILDKGKYSDFGSLDVVGDILPMYKRDIGNRLEYLRDDLHQLHSQGLVLYYKKALPDKVWLNPMALVTYIHEFILDKGTLERHGVIGWENLDDAVHQEITDLLILQKIVFHDEHQGRFIVPNFLPLAGQDADNFDLFSFGLDKPIFNLKFEDFLPFGMINDIIHFFGKNHRQNKFWRNQVLFKFEDKAKVMFKLDFEQLEIAAYCGFKNREVEKERQEVISYLFYAIMSLYWNMEPFDYDQFVLYQRKLLMLENYVPGDELYTKIYNADRLYKVEECRPDDMLISVDGRKFASYREICSDNAGTMIKVCLADEDGELNGETMIVPIYPFQPFTPNDLKRKKKVVVSYSKYDYVLVNRFLNHITPLVDDEIIEKPWLCAELIAGSEWDEEITRRFAQADIIFFMISDHLMQVDYVKEFEIRNAIDRYNKDGLPKIIPIILSPYLWQRKGDYDLGRFSALPFKAVAVTSFPDQNEAWKFIAQAVKLMITENAQPTEEGMRMNDEMRKICERLMDNNTIHYPKN
ncbi:MAG: TIR domain-containing protein [Sphingobacteriales bacterium]|nr:MAG: TIR domain-containing protein [Sphingobacteriales bacterium]